MSFPWAKPYGPEHGLMRWLDTSPVRSGRYRPLPKKFFWFGLVPCVVGLGYCGGAPAPPRYVPISQLAAIFYLAHFPIILPMIARIEKPLSLPASIAEAVRAKADGSAPAPQD